MSEGLKGGGLGQIGPKQLPARKVAVQQRVGKKMKVSVHNVKTIDERVKYIIEMIKKGRNDARVRKVTVQALARKCGSKWCVPEKQWGGEVKAWFDFVRQNVRYTRDTYNRDLFQHPARTLEFGGGDCDCLSILVGSGLQSVGYPIKLKIVRTHDSTDWNHIYLLVGLPPRAPEKWVSLDASVDKPAGWEAPASMIAASKEYVVD